MMEAENSSKPLKCSIELHDVTSQKTVILTVSTVRTSFIAKMSESFPERSQISELKFNYN
jgi:hypothetical protein